MTLSSAMMKEMTAVYLKGCRKQTKPLCLLISPEAPRPFAWWGGGESPWQPPGNAPEWGGVRGSVLTPHLLRAMYHHLSLTERKLRPPTQLRTSSFPSPSTWERRDALEGVWAGCRYLKDMVRFILQRHTESSQQSRDAKHISHPDIAWDVATRFTKRHDNRVTLAITLPNVINKHVVMLIEKKKKRDIILKKVLKGKRGPIIVDASWTREMCDSGKCYKNTLKAISFHRLCVLFTSFPYSCRFFCITKEHAVWKGKISSSVWW